ncbi:MAG: glycerol-3-phosphate 1-O-acyltransferase PlsY [Myxococcota bacterium]
MNVIQIGLLLLSYVGGSIPFGLIFAKIFSNKDIRRIGSGNIGTANVIRNAGLLAGLLTFLFDFLKGLIPVLVALHYYNVLLGVLAGFMAVTGHIFPIFLRFSGGKGVATAFGVVLGLNYLTALISFGIFILMIVIFRISSLSSLVATLSNLLLNIFVAFDKYIVLLNILLLLLIFFRHRENIKRLISGTEPRMWGRS